MENVLAFKSQSKKVFFLVISRGFLELNDVSLKVNLTKFRYRKIPVSFIENTISKDFAEINTINVFEDRDSFNRGSLLEVFSYSIDSLHDRSESI